MEDRASEIEGQIQSGIGETSQCDANGVLLLEARGHKLLKGITILIRVDLPKQTLP
jgi:hypothetical protein